MKTLLSALLLLAATASPAFATWSVIAVDARTGQVIIASATCVRQQGFPQRKPTGSRDLMEVQAVIVPGIGVAACQAGADNTRDNQMLVYRELKKGTPPTKILELLRAQEAARKPENQMERRQFGILAIPDGKQITRQNNHVGFNGTSNSPSSLYFSGQVGPDIYYQVQGNTLLGDAVMHQAALAFTRATGSLADRVMAAMEAADANGGDSRCNCGVSVLDFVPCDNKTAHVAYIAIADKDDKAGATHNDGAYYAYISVTDENTKPGESGNPVKTLRKRYDAWVRSGSPRLPPPPPSLFKGTTTSQQ
jgi:uncharacterized Ntn-hydrolase superfamily protein